MQVTRCLATLSFWKWHIVWPHSTFQYTWKFTVIN